MNLTENKLNQLESYTPNFEAIIQSRCLAAAELIHTGQYESAKDALGDIWQGVGNRPDVEGLESLTAAEVLLQCGVLSGWLGGSGHVKDSQERSKDLIFEALRLFQNKNKTEKVCEAQYELGMCYFREGAYDESRIVLQEAQDGANDEILKAKILVRLTLVQVWNGRYYDAFETLKKAELYLKNCDDALKGRWHGQMGLVMRRFGAVEGREEYFDRAIIEYTAAIYHYEQAGHERYCAINLNNLAFLFYKIGRYKEALEHLDNAAKILRGLNEYGFLTQVEETKAKVFLAEGNFSKADYLITNVIRKLEKGGESALLAEALTTHGILLAKLGKFERSICKLREAIDTATYAGASHHAGLAVLALIEEHGEDRLTQDELYDFYNQADAFLQDTQESEEIGRLRFCARIVTERLYKTKLQLTETVSEKTSLPDILHSFEAKLIEKALHDEDGSVSRAAKRLGIKHQSLAHLLNTRHQHLLTHRTPIIKRRRSIIRLREPHRTAHCKAALKEQQIRILHVEDNLEVAKLVKNMLLIEGWCVETCAEGSMALQLLKGDADYDIILLDNELPDFKGTELARRTKQLEHRQNTPIIVFSANFDEQEVLDAGVDVALKKPEDTMNLVTKIKLFIDKIKEETKTS